jgi:hypothetical protein
MGGPESTQDAVTMPGELYANFGLAGIPMMALFGMIFGIAYRFSSNIRFKFVYAAMLPPVMLTTFWMSFTGFVNAILAFPFVLLIITFVIKRHTYPQRMIPASLERAG